MDTEWIKLFGETTFPIALAVYLLILTSKKLERINYALIEVKVYMMILLSKSGININDPALSIAVKTYIEQQVTSAPAKKDI